MKNSIVIITLFIYSTFAFSQETPLDILKTDITWKKEQFKIPIGFVKDIEYEGIEDVKFAKNWVKRDHPNFWTYVFAWLIKGIQKQTAENLEQHLKLYFDSLMLPPNYKEQKLYEVIALFIKKT